jgi:hypothetical protein
MIRELLSPLLRLQICFIPRLTTDFAAEPATTKALQAATILTGTAAWVPPLWRFAHGPGQTICARWEGHGSSKSQLRLRRGTTSVRVSGVFTVRRNRLRDSA